jgi:serine/threonine protein kinase
MLNIKSNPMCDVWGVVDLEVVSAMQSVATSNSLQDIVVPVIPFGKINFDYNIGFIRGGFSRVYFGLYMQQKVAIKLLFVMELTKESIETFHSEARVLMDLQHESIISCYGITLLPPAFGVVMEFCKNGSLYSYLYEKNPSLKQYRRKKKQLSVTRDISPLFDNSAILQFSNERSFRAISGERKVSADFEMRKTDSSLLSENAICGILDSSVCYKMMLSAASGLAFFHSKRYCHCDMKSLNYLVTDVGRIVEI